MNLSKSFKTSIFINDFKAYPLDRCNFANENCLNKCLYSGFLLDQSTRLFSFEVEIMPTIKMEGPNRNKDCWLSVLVEIGYEINPPNFDNDSRDIKKEIEQCILDLATSFFAFEPEYSRNLLLGCIEDLLKDYALVVSVSKILNCNCP